MKREKKAQLTIFIIISLALVIVISLVFFLNQNNKNYSEGIEPVFSFVQGCIDKTADDAVYNIGKTGGYNLTPNLSTNSKIAYYFYNNRDYMPSKSTIEKELSNYFKDNLFLCINNFTDFTDLDIEPGALSSLTEIRDKEVVFNIKYPLLVKKDNKNYILDNFESNIPIRLGIIYNVAQEMILEKKENKDICLSCLGEIADKNDIYIEIMDYHGDTVFTLIDNQTQINSGDFRFNLAEYG